MFSDIDSPMSSQTLQNPISTNKTNDKIQKKDVRQKEERKGRYLAQWLRVFLGYLQVLDLLKYWVQVPDLLPIPTFCYCAPWEAVGDVPATHVGDVV